LSWNNFENIAPCINHRVTTDAQLYQKDLIKLLFSQLRRALDIHFATDFVIRNDGLACHLGDGVDELSNINTSHIEGVIL
jgi:hypothetical protein